MNKVNRVLCVVDPTTSVQPAVHRAAWLAQQAGADLDLFICFYNEYLSGERFFDAPSLKHARAELVERNREYLEKLAEPLRSAGVKVHTNVVWGHPLYEGIVRHAMSSGADMIFKDTHHHSAIDRALLTNTDWNLIRSCAAPLWLVKPNDMGKDPIFVAAVDPLHEHDKPAELDDEILDLSKIIADATGAEVRAFHSYDPRMAIATATANAYIPVSFPYEELEQQVVADHRKRFNELVEKHNVDSERSHLVAGLTHEELPEFCREIEAAVVVMGAVSRNRLKRLFIGATAERTLEHLPCDLLIVKPDWFRTPSEIAEDRAA